MKVANKPKIAIVDDEPPISALLSEILQDAGVAPDTLPGRTGVMRLRSSRRGTVTFCAASGALVDAQRPQAHTNHSPATTFPFGTMLSGDTTES